MIGKPKTEINKKKILYASVIVILTSSKSSLSQKEIEIDIITTINLLFHVKNSLIVFLACFSKKVKETQNSL